ncbi:MAG: dihydrolipoyllysine-residue succinyltransferase [Spirochaetales bacterium]|nr:dihydrolipoyllysine-residue succinyltransferase [Spirochaetales bacterium]
MKKNIAIPEMGESVAGGIIAVWLKGDGEAVQEGDELFELETDKATLAIPATASGILTRLAAEGDEVTVGQVVALVDADGSIQTGSASPENGTVQERAQLAAVPDKLLEGLSPLVRRIVIEHGLDPVSIHGAGRGGRITKEDALTALESMIGKKSAPQSAAKTQTRVPMTRLRKIIAENLVLSKQSSAHLTTFNEIDMSAVMDIRKKYRDTFEAQFAVRLGFMSFFAKTCCKALKAFPVANAFIDGEDIVYNNRYNIGVAVSTDRGLIVPVIRDADRKSFAEIEQEILSFVTKAREKKLTPDELSGGTFSITNGGVFGSLLSTPIPTPPQSAILGMHTIQKRPVAVGDEIAIRPMMYVAVSYDHRIMDGKDAVSFLVKIKQLVEDPHQLLLGL